MWKYEEEQKKQIQIKQIQKKSKSKALRKRWICILLKNLEDFYNKEGYRDGEFKKMIKVLG